MPKGPIFKGAKERAWGAKKKKPKKKAPRVMKGMTIQKKQREAIPRSKKMTYEI
jgi:hypothetical protein